MCPYLKLTRCIEKAEPGQRDGLTHKIRDRQLLLYSYCSFAGKGLRGRGDDWVQ
jgi:hypothetical protein